MKTGVKSNCFKKAMYIISPVGKQRINYFTVQFKCMIQFIGEQRTSPICKQLCSCKGDVTCACTLKFGIESLI